tara:strand:- start:272 stop:448 length:177 start_codon:yes stop_codon:yes gene_type:complete
MNRATIEVLDEGEKIFGSKTNGEFFVREYENDVEIGGKFFLTIEEAVEHVREFQTILN